MQDKADAPRQLGNFTRFAVWYLLMVALALMQYSGWLFGLPLLLAYFFILRSLHRLSRELDEAGYTIEAAPVRVSDRVFARLVAGVTLAGLACGYLFFHSYPMAFAPREPRSAEAREVVAQLSGLGFPDNVLADLADADLLTCAGAERVVVTGEGSERGGPDLPLRFTGVAVKLPIEDTRVGMPRERWMLFHYFYWYDAVRFRGTEAVALRNDFDSKDWASGETVTGRVLYDKGGRAYAAPYCSLETETFTQNSFFLAPSERSIPVATFSFPNGGTNHRFYLAHEVHSMSEDGYLISSWAEYVHQMSYVQFPVETARDFKLSGKWSSSDGPFRQVQAAIQFFPQNESAG